MVMSPNKKFTGVINAMKNYIKFPHENPPLFWEKNNFPPDELRRTGFKRFFTRVSVEIIFWV